MPSSRLAHLLLPSGALGLRAYDVLEETVFVGPGKQGLIAQALPFPKASVALTWQGDHFVVRALPGEPPPDVNGRPAEGGRLGHGDRLLVHGEVVAVRLEQPALPPPPTATVTAPVASPRTAAAPRAPGARRVLPPRAGWNHLTWILATLGLVLLLFAALGAIEHLGKLKDAERTRQVTLPEPGEPPAGDQERIVREVMAAEAFERERPHDVEAALGRWKEILARYRAQSGDATRPEVLAAASRIEALHARAAERALEALRTSTAEQVRAGRYASALDAVRAWERRFGDTPAAAATPALKDELQKGARTALDALVQKVTPLLTTAPRQAHTGLVGSGLELPPDLASEVAALVEVAIEHMRRRGNAPPPPAERPAPPAPPAPAPTGGEPPPAQPPEPQAQPPQPPAQPQPHAPALPADDAAQTARALWTTARDHLRAARGAEALASYDALLAEHGRLLVVKDNRRQIDLGRRAARAQMRGPAGLLAGPAELKKGRLEVDYAFSDPAVLEQDFSIEKPFASELPTDAIPEKGDVVLKGATGLFHIAVFTDDVRLEAEGTAVVAKDLGLLAVSDGDLYRAVLFDLANTRFKLKKGDAATVLPGHVLWFIGEGVWAAADPGEHGFIKIAERTKSTLEPGDRVKLTLARHKQRLEGGLESRTDGVSLEGVVKGDNGSGLGTARVGVFTNGGELRLRTLRISGVVDEAWFKRHLADLVAAESGPPEASR